MAVAGWRASPWRWRYPGHGLLSPKQHRLAVENTRPPRLFHRRPENRAAASRADVATAADSGACCCRMIGCGSIASLTFSLLAKRLKAAVLLFRPGGEIDEDADQHEHRIVEQAQQARRETQSPGRCAPRWRWPCAGPMFMARRARSTRPPSIGKAGTRLNSTRLTFTSASRSASVAVAKSIPLSSVQSDAEQQPSSSNAITTFTNGPAMATSKFLHRLLRHLLHVGDAANGRQDHVRRRDAKVPPHQDMPELMQRDAEQTPGR